MDKKKIILLNGSNKKTGETLRQAKIYGAFLEEDHHAHVETVHLADYEIKECKGCQICFDKGEEHCPLKDDLGTLLNILSHSHGWIVATPIYSLHITATLKKFIDRLSYLFHRSGFYTKKALILSPKGSLLPQASEYLKDILQGWLVDVVAVSRLPIIDYLPEKKRQIKLKEIQRQAGQFFHSIEKGEPKKPNMKDLISYNIWRYRARMKGEGNRDFSYFQEKGLFHKPYFYGVKIGFLKRVFSPLLFKVTLWYMKDLLGDLNRAI